jgi:hypothetical protein
LYTKLGSIPKISSDPQSLHAPKMILRQILKINSAVGCTKNDKLKAERLFFDRLRWETPEENAFLQFLMARGASQETAALFEDWAGGTQKLFRARLARTGIEDSANKQKPKADKVLAITETTNTKSKGYEFPTRTPESSDGEADFVFAIGEGERRHRRKMMCFDCKGPHIVTECPTYEARDKDDRINKCYDWSLCPKCLKGKHKAKDCHGTSTCAVCGQNDHHTMLHGGKLKRKAADAYGAANHWENTAQQEDQRNNYNGPPPSKQAAPNRQEAQTPQLNTLDPLLSEKLDSILKHLQQRETKTEKPKTKDDTCQLVEDGEDLDDLEARQRWLDAMADWIREEEVKTGLSRKAREEGLRAEWRMAPVWISSTPDFSEALNVNMMTDEASSCHFITPIAAEEIDFKGEEQHQRVHVLSNKMTLSNLRGDVYVQSMDGLLTFKITANTGMLPTSITPPDIAALKAKFPSMRGIHFYDFADRPGVDLLLGLEHWRLFRSLHEYPSGPRDPLVRKGFFGNTVINGPPLQEDSMAVWDEDLEVDKEQEGIMEPRLENGSPIMLIQGAGGMDDDEDDEDTDGSQDGNTGKRAKITPECRQHGGTMVEVERKETIPTTRKVEIVKKQKKGQVPSRVQPKRAMKEAKKNQE